MLPYNETITGSFDESSVIFCGLHILKRDQTFVGSVVVANIAHHKSVDCLFTFDDWKTVPKVSANFVRHIENEDLILGYDWFVFEIDISGITGLQSHTCILRARSGSRSDKSLSTSCSCVECLDISNMTVRKNFAPVASFNFL